MYSRTAWIPTEKLTELRENIKSSPQADFRKEGLGSLRNVTKGEYLINLIPQDHPGRIGIFRYLTGDYPLQFVNDYYRIGLHIFETGKGQEVAIDETGINTKIVACDVYGVTHWEIDCAVGEYLAGEEYYEGDY